MNRVLFVIFGDFLAFWISFVGILSVRFGPSYQEAMATHITPFTILYFVWVLVFFLFGLYDLFNIKPTIPHIRRFGLALTTSLITGILLFYLVPIFGVSPKTNLVFQIICFGILSFVLRRLFYILFSKQIIKPLVLVGETSYIQELHTIIEKNPQLGLKIILFTNNLHEALEKYTTLKNAVLVFEGTTKTIPKKDIVALYNNKNEIIDVALAYERYLYKIPVDYISQNWIIENICTIKNIGYETLTLCINSIFSFIILLGTTPLWILSALCIYIYDQGPILYTQERVGLHGKVFKLYKLRSMITESEKNGAVWSIKNDPRITPIGKIIRKLHIDEIPQMINILKGDLALVGPRPERPEFVSKLEQTIPHYELRHIIKPGFTGWAQIKYHYASTTEDSKEKFEYDLYYIKNRNIFMDFGIILRTIQIIFTH